MNQSNNQPQGEEDMNWLEKATGNEGGPPNNEGTPVEGQAPKHVLHQKVIKDAYLMPTEMAEELGITSRPFVVECRDGTRFCAPEASYLWVLPMTLQRLTGENE